MGARMRICHVELGEILEPMGDAWVIRTRRGGILIPVLFWLAGAITKQKRTGFDPVVFEQELKEVLCTPDGWRQLKVEWGSFKEEMRQPSGAKLRAGMFMSTVRKAN